MVSVKATVSGIIFLNVLDHAKPLSALRKQMPLSSARAANWSVACHSRFGDDSFSRVASRIWLNATLLVSRLTDNTFPPAAIQIDFGVICMTVDGITMGKRKAPNSACQTSVPSFKEITLVLHFVLWIDPTNSFLIQEGLVDSVP